MVAASLASSLIMAAVSPVLADRYCDVPAGYYRIVDPAGGTEVSLYADPSAQSQFLGTVHRGDIVFSEGIRTPRDNVTWQQVRLAQTKAWIPSRHLWRALPMTLAKTDLPAVGWCGDFAPLWSVSWTTRNFRVSLFPETHVFTTLALQSGMSPGTTIVNASSPDGAMTLVYSDAICRDQNGEVTGWGTAYLILNRNGNQRLYTGCCVADTAAFVKR
jgi:hypothetical protein